MVKTHLPAHMDSVRQNFRPKHQLLILKCYPRLPKNSAAEAKPNGSELSYLLYYASTRRSKLQKVGSFLERKTASDVSRSQSARVMVTLMILTALLENRMVGAGSGFALIAPYILRVIREILVNTNDISLIEASTKTWDVFCEHQDPALLAADHEYRVLYEQVVQRYTALAHKTGVKKLGNSTARVAVQDQIRLREAGLGAIKSVLSSDALASESGRQLDVVVPAILSNMRGSDSRYLLRLARQSKRDEDEEKEKAINRRMSMVATRTLTSISDDTDPRQAEGTASDADEIAEEHIAVLALTCLRSVFMSENRGQVRTATEAVLKYLSDLQAQTPSTASQRVPQDIANSSWATKLFEMCTAWIPVQDRFILLLTTIEILVRLPLKEADIRQHLLYTNLIDHVLRSDLNLIGLSVMDILLGLIQQILRVLQLGGPQDLAAAIRSSDNLARPATKDSSAPLSETPPATPARIHLTERLRDCVANLATHVYYTDQVADMIAAVLLRLKPNPIPAATQNPITTAAAIEEPRLAVTEVASNASISARERSSNVSAFFSFGSARYIALEAVRDILKVANSAQSLSSGGVAESRNKVPISIWEGTQWLLRDPAPPVRRMYVDALTTWLALETKPADFRIKEPQKKPKKSTEAMARRAISNASLKHRGQSKKATSTFLQLLHLAVYENVVEYAETSESDMLILHLLLTTLVRKLGVNAVQGGLPMVVALQDDWIKSNSSTAKVRSASLVHGYLWTLTEVFNFDISPVGREVVNEITWRKNHGIWLRNVSVPPAPIESILEMSATNTDVPPEGTAKEEPRAFTDRKALVDHISAYYMTAIASPPTSPPGSPARSPSRPFNVHRIERAPSSYLTANPAAGTPMVLPDKVKDAMMDPWSREKCLAAIAAAAPKSVSLSGSRTSPSQALLAGNNQQILAAAGTTSQGKPYNLTPSVPPIPANHRQQAFGKRLDSQSPARKGSAGGSSNRPASSSADGKGTLHVDELKRILVSGATLGVTTSVLGKMTIDTDDTASDSMVDAEDGELGSENGSVGHTLNKVETHTEHHPTIPQTVPEHAKLSSTDEPPILSLLRGAVTDGRFAADPSTNGTNGFTAPPLPPPPPSRDGRMSVRSRPTTAKKDLRALLAGIGSDGTSAKTTTTTDVEKEKRGFGGMERPPY